MTLLCIGLHVPSPHLPRADFVDSGGARSSSPLQLPLIEALASRWVPTFAEAVTKRLQYIAFDSSCLPDKFIMLT